jgi:hypothetical protein
MIDFDRYEAVRAVIGMSPKTLRSIIAFARETWRNDGAEGETVWRLAEIAERMVNDDAVEALRSYLDTCAEDHDGVGFDVGEVDHHGEIELRLHVGSHHGSMWLSREMWHVIGERAGWSAERELGTMSDDVAGAYGPWLKALARWRQYWDGDTPDIVIDGRPSRGGYWPTDVRHAACTLLEWLARPTPSDSPEPNLEADDGRRRALTEAVGTAWGMEAPVMRAAVQGESGKSKIDVPITHRHTIEGWTTKQIRRALGALTLAGIGPSDRAGRILLARLRKSESKPKQPPDCVRRLAALPSEDAYELFQELRASESALLSSTVATMVDCLEWLWRSMQERKHDAT